MVDFLHRTVRDFLQTEEIRNLLHSYSSGEYNSHKALCRAFLVQIRALCRGSLGPPRHKIVRRFMELVDNFVTYAVEIETRTGTPPLSLIDELENTIAEFLSQHNDDFDYYVHVLEKRQEAELENFQLSLWTTLYRKERTFLSFLVQAGFRLSATAKLIEDPSSIQKSKMPLLYYAVFREMEVTPGIRPPDVELIRLMLELGAEADSDFREFSVWKRLLLSMHSKEIFTAIREDTGPWKETTELLILHGAKKDGEIDQLPFQRCFGPEEGRRLEMLLEEQSLIASQAEERTAPTNAPTNAPTKRQRVSKKFKRLFS